MVNFDRHPDLESWKWTISIFLGVIKLIYLLRIHSRQLYHWWAIIGPSKMYSVVDTRTLVRSIRQYCPLDWYKIPNFSKVCNSLKLKPSDSIKVNSPQYPWREIFTAIIFSLLYEILSMSCSNRSTSYEPPIMCHVNARTWTAVLMLKMFKVNLF